MIFRLSDVSIFFAIQEIFKEATVRLEESVSLVKLPPWPAAALQASHEGSNYLAHRFGKAVRLTANIGAFDKFLPRNVLQDMIFDRLLQQQVDSRIELTVKLQL